MSEDVTEQSWLADSTVNHITLSLDKDLFAWWLKVGKKFRLTSHSQIAAFLLHGFQVKGAGETSSACSQCGSTLSWLCVPCLSQFLHNQSSQHDPRHKLLPDQGLGITDTVKQEDGTRYKDWEGGGGAEEEDGDEEENTKISTTTQRYKQNQRTKKKGRRKEFSRTSWHRRKRRQDEEEEDASSKRRSTPQQQRQPQPTCKKVKVDDDSDDIEEEGFECRPKRSNAKAQPGRKVKNVDHRVGSLEDVGKDFDDDSLRDPWFEVRKPTRKRGRPRKTEQQGERPRKGEGTGQRNNADDQKAKKEGGSSCHICDACGKVLATVSSLNKHKRIMHTSEFKPHMCELCSKAFRSLHKLKLHGMRHTGEKAHPCDVCGKAFDSRYHMKRHRLIHAGVKTHLCDTCGKKFLHKSALKQHRQLHTEQKRHLCDVCSKTFFRASNLKEHKLFHSGHKPHCCPVCAQNFTLHSHLKRHMLRVHMKDKGPIKGKMAQVHVAADGGCGDGGDSGGGGVSGEGGGGGVTQIPEPNLPHHHHRHLHTHHHLPHTHPNSLSNSNTSGLKMADSPQVGELKVTGSPPQSEVNRAALENMPVYNYHGAAQAPDQLMGGPSLTHMGGPVGPVFSHNEFGCLFQTNPYHRSANPYSTHSGDSQA